jgi:hypothetical protein
MRHDKGESLEIPAAATAETSVGEMQKRRETMADGRRYIIYYTFEDAGDQNDSGFRIQDSGLEENPTPDPKSKIQNPKSNAGLENV